MQQVKEYAIDFFRLFFPAVCAACGRNLVKKEHHICTHCLYYLPRTRYHFERDNPVSQLFWGRVNIENATSFFFFHKKSKYQNLIHNIKYRGQKDTGKEMGRIFGYELKESPLFYDIDAITFVPLHKKKEKARGFNQSEWIALGMAESLNKRVYRLLDRQKYSSTQTRKGRYDRWKNVEDIFQLKAGFSLHNKHILLVDDVVTTGSTLEACASVLLDHTHARVSVATLGFSK